jgi:hypothetical protein
MALSRVTGCCEDGRNGDGPTDGWLQLRTLGGRPVNDWSVLLERPRIVRVATGNNEELLTGTNRQISYESLITEMTKLSP